MYFIIFIQICPKIKQVCVCFVLIDKYRHIIKIILCDLIITMSNNLPIVSFIIPAKNEEAMLPSTLDCIHLIVSDHFKYEVIVVDNGSNDHTVDIAKKKGAQVLVQTTGTIGSLRNVAAKTAKGKCLVFLDADVSITKAWLHPFLEVMATIQIDENIIIGSRCSTAEDAGWIANSWFRRAPTLHMTTHVGTGHMITSKRLFDRIGGFDESFKTGEDYEFCARAKREGASIFENHKLRVIHHGVPRTLSEFMRREIWHGTGDVQTINVLLHSKVAMLSLLFLVAHLWLVGAILFSFGNGLQILISFIVVMTIVATSAWWKYHYAPMYVILRNVVLYYFYFWARSLSIINRVLPIVHLGTPRAGR